MARRLSDSLINNAIKLYSDGLSIAKISAALECSEEALRKRFKAIGVPVTKIGRYKGRNAILLPSDEIISMYDGGKSENFIAKHFNVSRNVIRRYLVSNNANIRTQSQAEKLKWSQMTDEQRANQLKSAHSAAKGRTRTTIEKIKMALSREQSLAEHHIGIGEPEFREFLDKQGVNYIYQKAVDGYNIDFAIGNVAVEITSFTGRYRAGNPIQQKRIEHLFKRGYIVIAVEIDCAETLVHFAGEILANINATNRLNSTTRQYRVIRCRKQSHSVIRDKLGKFTSIPSPVQFFREWKSVDF